MLACYFRHMALNDSPQNVSDLELVNRTIDIDKEYFNELVRRYSAKIYRYLNRLLSRNTADVDECFSETFLKAYVNLSTYNPRVPFSAWLYRIAHNQAIDYMRRNVHRNSVELEEWHAVYDPAEEYIDRDYLASMLRRISSDERNLLILFYLEGLSLQEISDIIKIKPNTIAVRIKRAKAKIRKTHEQH